RVMATLREPGCDLRGRAASSLHAARRGASPSRIRQHAALEIRDRREERANLAGECRGDSRGAEQRPSRIREAGVNGEELGASTIDDNLVQHLYSIRRFRFPTRLERPEEEHARRCHATAIDRNRPATGFECESTPSSALTSTHDSVPTHWIGARRMGVAGDSATFTTVTIPGERSTREP